jgi:hypothetical protein
MSLPNSNGTGPSPRQLSLINENGCAVLRDVDQNGSSAVFFSQNFGQRLSAQFFPRGLRVDGERMHAIREFLGQCRINHAMALDPALPFERLRHNINAEMRLAARLMPGMALMQM